MVIMVSGIGPVLNEYSTKYECNKKAFRYSPSLPYSFLCFFGIFNVFAVSTVLNGTSTV